MPKHSMLAVLLVTLVVIPSFSPAQQSAAPFAEVIDIRVTNVDVVVTDRSGAAVPGLTRDDFEIYEDGKQQEISNFYEAVSSPSPVATTSTLAEQSATNASPANLPRMFIFYFDNGSLSVKNRNVIFPAVNEFLAKNMLSGDKVMIVSWGGSLQVRLPWTTDLSAVEATLKSMRGENIGSSAVVSEQRRIERELKKLASEADDPNNAVTFQMLESHVRSYSENVRVDVTRSVNALSRMLASLSGVDGRKVLVLATELLPTQAGAEVAEELERIRIQAMTSSTSTLRAGAMRGSRLTDQQRYNLTPIIELLGKSANASGVTIYAVNPKGTGNDESGKVETTESLGVGSSFAGDVQILSGVNMLASLTGGQAMVGAPATMALDHVARDLNSYYSLGYRAQAGPSPDRKIEVRMKRPGLNARSRQHVYYRSIETEMADRVMASHLHALPPNDLAIAVVAGATQIQGKERLLTITVFVPIDKMTLLPGDHDNLSGGFSVFVSSGSSSADISRVNIQTHKLDLPKGQVAAAKGKAVGYAVQVPLEKGRDQISVGVLDLLSQTQGFAMVKVAEPGA